MKEKIKNFLLKIKNVFNEKYSFSLIELIVICILINLLTLTLSHYVIMAKDYCFNETHTEQVEESPQTESIIIDRDIKGTNNGVGTSVPNSGYIENVYFNLNLSSLDVVNIINSANLLFDGDGAYTLCADVSNGNSLSIMNSSLLFGVDGYAILDSLFGYGWLFVSNESLYTILAEYGATNVGWRNGFSGIINYNTNVIDGGSQNNSLSSLISITSFETDSSIVDTSCLTLNETNFDRSVFFSTFLTKESIAGYFSQLTYETSNFITPSLTLNGVDSYTIITGRIGSVPIANYIPSLVVVKYESKYVVYNYLRDNYLTPIYDTSTGVLDNVLGDGIYFLDVSSPTYFGSQNDKINLFISAINIADSPLYSLISIGYTNGYDFGYGYGYNSGYQVGFGDGDESGYNEGYDTGFENGFADGRDTANSLGPVMSLFKDTADVVASVLNVQILPNITIGTILLFPLVALLFALFIRLFFGG